MNYDASVILESIREAAEAILAEHIEELRSHDGTRRDLINFGASLVLDDFDDILDRDFAGSLVEDYLAEQGVGA